MDWLGLIFGPDGWGGLLLNGAIVTILLALTTIPFGFGFGLALAVLKLSKSRIVRGLCEGYTTFFRGIPDLLSLFIVYFGLQALIDRLSSALQLTTHIELGPFVAGVIALSVVVAAYSSEVWVAALKSVPKGQQEAGQALGLDRWKTFALVTWPQLIRVALPGLGNIWMVLLKDTSLVSTLALVDLLRAASEASKNTTRPILFYSAAAAIYLIFSIVSGLVQTRLEKRANRGFA
ncbi:MAG: ABC transporter permease subunit [Methylobacteriaceae bacterium]|nr:ABC transporter permease subunit [Methylobacteriaceae bacterium]